MARLLRVHSSPTDRGLPLQDQALGLLLLFPGEQGSSCGVFEYFADTLVRLCRALEILLGANLLTDILGLGVVLEAVPMKTTAATYLLRSDGLLGRLVQLLNGLLVEAQILLAANKDDGQALAEVQDFGDPLWHGQ